LRATPEQLVRVPHIGEQLAASIPEAIRTLDVDGELALMEKHGVHARLLNTPDYPPPLTQIHDPPHVLYVRGALEERDTNAVAIVGSRRFSAYGKRAAEHLAAGLVQAGYTIISGLARGIDGAAHRAALQAGGRTIAVMAGGLSRIYPPEHKDLAQEVSQAGALVAEASMAQEPLPNMFPARNRIISGLSRAVILVEADEKSGALITATHAAAQGRCVLAVPGPIDVPSSRGTNALIREGAVLCRGVEDVLEELQGVSAMATAAKKNAPPQPAAPTVPAGPPPGLDDTQRRVWDFLAGPPRHLDEMVQELGLAVSLLSGLLLTLEMKKVVRRLPGNRYERC
jgi:DNA processing protein